MEPFEFNEQILDLKYLMSEESLSTRRQGRKTTKKVRKFKKYMNFKLVENAEMYKPVLATKRQTNDR